MGSRLCIIWFLLTALVGCAPVPGDDDAAGDDDMSDDDSEPPFLVPECEELQGESGHCISLMWSQSVWNIGVVGMDSGEVCVGPEVDSDHIGDATNGMGLVDNYVYACDIHELYNPCGRLVRVSVVDGELETADVFCSSVANYGETIIVMDSCGFDMNPVRINMYDSFASAQSQDANVLYEGQLHAERIGVAGDSLFAAWHSTDQLLVYDLPEMSGPGILELESYDTWVTGISGLGKHNLVLNAYWPDGRLAIFDRASGNLVADVLPDPPTEMAEMRGLACF